MLTVVSKSQYLEELRDVIETRIANANKLFGQHPEKATPKAKAQAAELDYRLSIISKAEDMLPDILALEPWDMHMECSEFYHKLIVTESEDFAHFVSADKSNEAKQMQIALCSAVEVFSVDFDYNDMDECVFCFTQYIEEIVRYVLYFREKYTKLATRK